jgi:hypothetical protein
MQKSGMAVVIRNVAHHNWGFFSREANREIIELKWTLFMLKQQWVTFIFENPIVVLTAYPNSHNQFERKIDLSQEFPGAYTAEPKQSWYNHPPTVRFDHELCSLMVGTNEKTDDWDRVYLPEILWI